MRTTEAKEKSKQQAPTTKGEPGMGDPCLWLAQCLLKEIASPGGRIVFGVVVLMPYLFAAKFIDGLLSPAGKTVSAGTILALIAKRYFG